MEYLGARGKELYQDYCELCRSIGLDITGPRQHEVMALAKITEEFEKLAEYVNKNGTTQKTPKSDYKQTSPEFSNMMKAHDAMVKHMTKLGVYDIELNPVKESKEDAQAAINSLRKVGT